MTARYRMERNPDSGKNGNKMPLHPRLIPYETVSISRGWVKPKCSGWPELLFLAVPVFQRPHPHMPLEIFAEERHIREIQRIGDVVDR